MDLGSHRTKPDQTTGDLQRRIGQGAVIAEDDELAEELAKQILFLRIHHTISQYLGYEVSDFVVRPASL